MSLRTRELSGLAFVVAAIAFNAVFLAPEIEISRLPLNDGVLHLAASERLGQAIAQGEPFLDPWVDEWALGYPMWRSYQPLPHLLGAAAIAIGRDPPAAFAFLQYLLMVLLPASFYLGARRLGLPPLAAGLASLLAITPSETGNFGGYGISYASMTWRGTGLYTQLLALHLFVIAVGTVARAVDSGRGRAQAAILLALTGVSHIVFGYTAFVTAGLLALVGAPGERARRFVRLATVAIPAVILLSWFVLPLARVGGEINHSRWEAAWKWDSFGAPAILGAIAQGKFFDEFRFPSLTILIAAGTLLTLRAWREPLARRLLVLTLAWLLLFFGRDTWGHLLIFVGVPRDFHLHRLEGAFEIFAVFTAALGLSRLLENPRRGIALASAALVAAALFPIARERIQYLAMNRAWGESNLQAYERERRDLEAAFAETRRILEQRPGRVSAGLAGGWGREFLVGSVPLFGYLTREHFDQPSMLYHAMSRTSEIMVLRSDDELAHHVALGIRAVIAPADRNFPSLTKRGVFGRFAVWEASSEGYFGLVDLGARYLGAPGTDYNLATQWLGSEWLRRGRVVLLDERGPLLPSLGRWDALPPPPILPPAGRILTEERSGARWHAQLELVREAHALLKITWFPDLRATVDGAPAPVLRVTPGFAAVPVPPGRHDVIVEYAPGPLKPILFVLSIALFLASLRLMRRLDEAALTARVEPFFARLDSPSLKTALALAALLLVALHPLLRGKLMDGHDSTAYLPRLVEMARALRDGQLPPVWAPDLGNGHGQPLFEFAPPLAYLAAMPFYALGARIADAYQLGLFWLVVCGAIAMFALARRFTTSRTVAGGVVAAWLFVPYLSLDFFVRVAFAEAAAVAVAPIALAAIFAALQHGTPRRVLLAALAVALIPLAHFGTAVLLLPALALVVAASERRLAGVAALAGGLGLAAFSWLPAMLEKDFTKAHLLREDFLRWSEHAVAPWQLLWSRWGYGISLPGTVDDGMSFSLGPIQLALALAGFVIARRDRRMIAFAVAALGGAFLATTLSSPIWSRLTTLQYLVYPWRALALPALFLPLLALFALERLRPPLRLAVLGALVAVNLPHTEPKRFLDYDEDFYAPREIATRHMTTSTREEYEPRDVEQRPPFRAQRLVGREAPIAITAQTIGSRRERFTTRTISPTLVEAGPYYFPGWRALVDGVEVPIAPAPSSGLITFTLPAGEHRVELSLERTPPRTAGLVVSAATLLALLLTLRYRPKVASTATTSSAP